MTKTIAVRHRQTDFDQPGLHGWCCRVQLAQACLHRVGRWPHAPDPLAGALDLAQVQVDALRGTGRRDIIKHHLDLLARHLQVGPGDRHGEDEAALARDHTNDSPTLPHLFADGSIGTRLWPGQAEHLPIELIQGLLQNAIGVGDRQDPVEAEGTKVASIVAVAEKTGHAVAPRLDRPERDRPKPSAASRVLIFDDEEETVDAGPT